MYLYNIPTWENVHLVNVQKFAYVFICLNIFIYPSRWRAQHEILFTEIENIFEQDFFWIILGIGEKCFVKLKRKISRKICLDHIRFSKENLFIGTFEENKLCGWKVNVNIILGSFMKFLPYEIHIRALMLYLLFNFPVPCQEYIRWTFTIIMGNDKNEYSTLSFLYFPLLFLHWLIFSGKRK